MKRKLYDQVQGSRESVREISRALLEISDRAESKDNMLIEVFYENLLEPQIKREIRLVRTDTKILAHCVPK